MVHRWGARRPIYTRMNNLNANTLLLQRKDIPTTWLHVSKSYRPKYQVSFPPISKMRSQYRVSLELDNLQNKGGYY